MRHNAHCEVSGATNMKRFPSGLSSWGTTHEQVYNYKQSSCDVHVEDAPMCARNKSCMLRAGKVSAYTAQQRRNNSELGREYAEHTYQAKKSSEKWMVILYTSSEDSFDQLTTFRCMLVRLLLQHHHIVFEERDISLPQFQAEFQDRLAGDKLNVPQVFMHGFNIGGYRTMYAIHKLDVAQNIFGKFILTPSGYAEWMFNKDSKMASLSLDGLLGQFNYEAPKQKVVEVQGQGGYDHLRLQGSVVNMEVPRWSS
ncbi:hypothetical protein PoB_007196700 [Plakobranchus ocellatus]|uniref:Glutaredoxin domain-containing protein n=1 Tax=Plakobranchus ocellatus TaxID=259542 RepID=A0AAV4DMG1_9GAST|nr:hypothetical protein PoB_007196700 [Plakobranchus ocellatus]